MEQHVELQRRFLELDDAKDPEAAALESYIASISGTDTGVGWAEIFAARESIVILGEPGSGKTHEMGAQMAGLRRQGACAALVELGQVVSTPTPPLSHDDLAAFALWRANKADAWLFLDAVDESKLVRIGDFRAALKNVSAWVGSRRDRTHYVISSRISEWRFRADKDLVVNELLGKRHTSQAPAVNPPTVVSGFSPGLGLTRISAQSKPVSASDTDRVPPKLKVVKLLPLTRDQVLHFLQTFGGDPHPFLDAVKQIDALEFVGRPDDARDLYALWKKKGRLGTKIEMLEQSTEIKLQLKEDRSGVALSRLREGVEAVCACLHLSRHLAITIEEQFDDALIDSIPLRSCLPQDWSEKERHSLIQRPIFDGATYGRIRVHHRTHQDYLAACWFRGLMDSECPYSELRQIVFDERSDGKLILRPFMASVAAWLACIASPDAHWSEALKAGLLTHTPWVFLAHGDPQSLPVQYRLDVLRNIVEHFRGRDHVQIDWDRSTLKRFADPGLASDLATWIADPSMSADIRADYMFLVQLGHLHAAMQPVVDIATSSGADEYLRATALGCIARAGSIEQRSAVLTAALSEPRLSIRIAGWIASCVYPVIADETDLFDILSKISAQHSKISISSLDQFEREVVMAPDGITGKTSERFLQALTRFLRDDAGACRNDRAWAADWLEPSIARLLRRPSLGEDESTLIIEALALLCSARESHLTREWRSDKNGSLNDLSLAHPALRRQWFLWKYDDSCREQGKEPTHLFQLRDHYDLMAPHPDDRNWWFNDALSGLSTKRIFALRAGLSLPQNTNRPGRSWPPLRILMASMRDQALRAIVREILISDLSFPWQRLKNKWQWEWSQDYYWKQKWHPVREWYWYWVNKIHFLWKKRNIAASGWWNACYHVVERARHLARDKSHSRWGGLDAADIDRTYGPLVGKTVRTGLDKHWRQHRPPLPHEKPERNQTPATTVLGLVALDIAWSEYGTNYFAGLSESDASVATRYALNELNGFPDWMPSLVAHHRHAVQAIFDEAICGEWQKTLTDVEVGSDTLGRLEWNESELPRMAVPTVRSLLLESATPNLRVLTSSIQVSIKHDAGAGDWLVPLARKRLGETTASDQAAWVWLIALMQFDADAGFDIIEKWTNDLAPDAISDMAVRLCASLANRHQRSISINNPDFLRPKFLLRFIPWVFRYVRPENDPDHEGAYSPTAHDDAARFRPQLIEALVTSDMEGAEEILHQLVVVPELVRQRDWLIASIDRRRARVADNLRLEPGDVFELRALRERPPRSRADLFHIASDRIRGFKDLVELAENSIRREAVVSDWKEKDYQFWIKKYLDVASHGRYVLSADAEIDPGKFPDLRFENPGIDGAISVEVKVADEWSHRVLMDALRDQLVGQYLRAHNANYGIYLLFHNGKQHHWIPDGQSPRDWEGLLSDLQTLANQIRESRLDIERLIVVGIDVSKPEI